MKTIVSSAMLLSALIGAPAHADVVGFVQAPEGRIELHEDRGVCKAQAKRAEYLPVKGGEAVPGCWITKGAFVGIVFLDGDIAQIPMEALQKPIPV